MGLLVEGVWKDQWYDTAASGGRFVRTEFAVPALGHPGRTAGSLRRGRVCRRARPLSPLCLARLPMGAPHADLCAG